MSIIGLEFGYARAIRWARTCGNGELADRIRNKVIPLYRDNYVVNFLSLISILAIGDKEQAKLIKDILKFRLDNGPDKLVTTT